MKRIPLTQGYEALVDDEDYNWLMQWKWCVHMPKADILYAVRNGGKPNGKHKTIFMHREIAGAAPGQRVDHRNRNHLDNRKSNLRPATQSQNMANSVYRKLGKSSRYKGVCWKKDANKWVAGIRVQRKSIHLGYFNTEEEAALAYNEAALRYFGEFAWLNDVPIVEEGGQLALTV